MDANPWTILAGSLHAAVYPSPLPQSFGIQLWVLLAFFSSGLVFALLGVAVRIQKGNFFLFKIEPGSRGGRELLQDMLVSAAITDQPLKMKRQACAKYRCDLHFFQRDLLFA